MDREETGRQHQAVVALYAAEIFVGKALRAEQGKLFLDGRQVQALRLDEDQRITLQDAADLFQRDAFAGTKCRAVYGHHHLDGSKGVHVCLFQMRPDRLLIGTNVSI